MAKKNIILNLFFLLFFIWSPAYINSQTLSQNVIGSIGGLSINDNFGSVHWTVGEMMTKTIEGENTVQLTQGFHQSYYEIITSNPDDVLRGAHDITFFPNPTSGHVFLNWKETVPERITVTNPVGQILLQSSTLGNNEMLDLNTFSEGIYFLSIFKDQALIKTFKIVKY